MRKYRDGQGAEQRQFKKGYTKKTSNPRTTLRTALVHYVRSGRKQNHIKARDFRKPVIF